MAQSPRALILIDFQIGFDDPAWGGRNNPGAEANAARLLAHWREKGWPIFHVRHLSTEPRSPLNPANGQVAFKPEVAPLEGEPVLEKQVNSAFIGTDLEDRLACAAVAANADTSWRDGGKSDAKFIHQAALDHLHGEFAEVVSVEDVLAG
ncbi:MAG: isochorismatase family protein [Maritimibacter sp.]